MKSKIIKTIAVVLILSVMAAIPILAEQVSPPEGGTWEYGMDGFLDNWVYSNYYHPYMVHGSSVQGCIFVSNYNVIPGSWSRAGTYAAISGNHVYYCTGPRDEADSVNPTGLDTEFELHGVALD